MNWRDRVVEMRRVPASELNANPKIWRVHPPEQQRAMQGVREEVGIAGALLARETPDGLELIDGHLRTELADDTEWPVLVLDVDENEADVLLASVDPIGALAKENTEKLDELLRGLYVENETLAEMLATVEAPTYEVLDLEDVDDQLQQMAGDAKRALLIEFDPDDYEAALDLTRAHRKAGRYVGGIVLKALRAPEDDGEAA